jgi:ADP-ribosylglycohydrolase
VRHDVESGGPVTPVPEPSFLEDRIVGSLTAAAVGDAVGGATEGWSPDQIRARRGGWVTGIVDPHHGENWRTARPISPYHKGDGHFTDDTIMTLLLCEVYAEQQRHLTAYDVADQLVPKLLGEWMWIPELGAEAVPIHRLFLAEKHLALRVAYANVDPREAGAGNMVNCGAAMYMAPVGLVNAGDPDAAYAEAIDIAAAHQHSYGREAAGVVAAAVAAAAAPSATVADVLATAARVAKDGTRAAIDAVVDAAERFTHWSDAIESGALRDAMRPFDTVGDEYRNPGLGARRASRIHAIEELPVALAMVRIAGGEVLPAILGGVNYGRDSDSIASIAGALAGALGGAAAVPQELLDAVCAASRTDLVEPARRFAGAARAIRTADLERARGRAEATERLLDA